MTPHANSHPEPERFEGIAVIGMAGRFPGAPNLDTFWSALLEGRDTITRFSAEQLEGRSSAAHERDAAYVAARGVLDGVDQFDAAYFGIVPREAERMDPQHRLFLEACANALGDAGYGAPDYPGEIGLFAGCSLNTYLLANLMPDRAALDELAGSYQVGEFQTALGNDKDFLTTRVAYKLNLRGPCISVQSACATSLVAICQASQALLNYQCDMALAGGVSVTFPQHRGHVYNEGGIVSRDGFCRPFDAQATGTVFGHGVGVVLLKRLDDALRDGDHIEAVIRGFAVNNDGSGKAGYMAPGVDGQARVVRAAHALAGVDPGTITYIEAHGTGTPLGDPIEIAALTQAFRAGTAARSFCAVGTAKGNVGHLDSAAGVTGFIKTVLSMRHRTLPGLAHFERPNPAIDLTNSPFVFHAHATPWQSDGPLRAGVSAFGVGGVNAHIVLEEPPPQPAPAPSRPKQVICVSARSQPAALEAARQLADRLTAHPDLSLPDAAFTLARGRMHHPFRIAVPARSTGEAVKGLLTASPRQAAPRRLAYLFSGQGTQYAGMGRDLYQSEPCFRAVVEDCSQTLGPLLGCDLRPLLFADPTDLPAAAALAQTRFAQPALFVIELALAELWSSWGVFSSAALGHSLGEYVAATLAGVFSRKAALQLVATRGRLMQQAAAGAMLSVALGEAEVAAFVKDEVSVAALNAPRASVLSGTLPSIELAEAELTWAGVATRRLQTSHAFHSAMMAPMLADFEVAVTKADPKPPTTRFVSSVTGDWITREQATDPHYWGQQCRQPVQFRRALETLMADGVDVLLEVGPGDTLTRLALQQTGSRADLIARPSFASARAGRPEVSAYDALADLWAAGVQPDWSAVFAHEARRRISLPTYPFERQSYWVAPPSVSPLLLASPEHSLAEGMSPMSLTQQRNDEAPAPAIPRAERLRTRVAQLLGDLSGIEIAPGETSCSFLELGFDSLLLTQAAQTLSKAFATKISLRQLMEQHPSVAGLADHLDRTLPADAVSTPVAPHVAPPVPAAAANSQLSTSESALERLLSEQVRAMSELFSQQVATLRAAAGVAPAPQANTPAPRATTLAPQANVPAPQANVPAKPAAPSNQPEVSEVRHGSFRALQPGVQGELTAEQRHFIDDLIAHSTARTPTSKRLTQAGRDHLSDPRAVAGFRPQWKEMVYPLLVERARGSRLWDVDGNEYIDIVNGYGCILFGHSPEFVVEAACTQLQLGVAIGPQTPLAAEVASLLCELTGNERATFCNTGSEAVMAAIRVARTVTGRDKLVYFAGDYHGTFDEVLIRNTPRGSAPVAPGIPLSNVTNVVVLEYGAQASLDYIRANAAEIAAVLVEPVQTRNPALQPADFLREVRAITEAAGCAMILDEVVTGFRLAPGGAQQHFGIRADLCTYGKVIGGGHPIGVLSGKRTFMDALDGGAWQYGDDSSPEVGVTFFAGTFVRHPLAMAAARAVLTHLRDAGPQLQRELNARTTALAGSLDRFMQQRGVPTRIHHFCSWFYFTFPHDARLGSLLYYAMRAKGIHIQEGYPCFLTTAHTDADLAAIEHAFRETVVEMQAAGVLPCLHPAAPSPSPELSASVPERVPLTEPQREIFLAAALSDDANCAFNESLMLELRGPIREPELIVALETVHARHDALRSTVSEDGEWLVIGREFKTRTDIRDLRALPAEAQADALQEIADEEARTPFELVRGPLARSIYLRVADDRAVLILTAHHIVLDGWSANQLLEEIGKIYSRGAAAQSELAELLPFSRYALDERKREADGEFAANERFWTAQFAGRTPRLDLPTDRARPREKSYEGSTWSGQLGPELLASLKQTSARLGCTLYATLLSGFQLLLHRLTGQDEVVVGISTAGQALVGAKSLVGHCVHFLPMLSQLAEGMTGRQHVQATRSALLDAYDHQEFTYGSLLRTLQLVREPGRLPLIEVQFNLERVGTNVAFDGLTTSMRALPKAFVNTDLFLNVVETSSDLEYHCDFNTTLFDRSTVARWLASWAELLRALVSSPDQPAASLNLLPDEQRSQLLSSSTGPTVDFGSLDTVASTFLRRAERMPHGIALVCDGKSWTNAELAAYARSLAQRLQAEGVGRGTLVAIAIRRSPQMAGALLAVMLAGGAWVPLDSRHPRERLERILEDSGATLLLTDHAPDLKTHARILNLRQIAPTHASFVPAALAAEDLAYVIYTSGSTGTPKGVAVEHGALQNLLRSMQREPGLTDGDTLVAITTLAFDIAALELLLPLLSGARLVIATEEQVTEGMELANLIEETQATVLQATPGAWRILMDAGWTGARPLKGLCGGEALPRDLADALLDRNVELWNVYGPTETTIWSSATRVERGSGTLRLGTPIANTQFYVLTEDKQLAPLGVDGELYIGGKGLARGYWRRDELTAAKFTPNPFAEGRIYATGDLARRMADGTIELLGRSDFQVKIRGYRIELGEIESALRRHPHVRDAAVVAQTTGTGARLVAYLETGCPADSPEAQALPRELTPMLADALPDYMIPAAFVTLATLPRTPNGKLDRNALPEPSSEAFGRPEMKQRPFAAAESPEQEQLVAIWAEVLGQHAVSIHDSIFELGADSLAIFRIAARAQRAGLALKASDIFQRRTIAELTATPLSTEAAAQPAARLPARIHPAARERYRLNKVEVDA